MKANAGKRIGAWMTVAGAIALAAGTGCNLNQTYDVKRGESGQSVPGKPGEPGYAGGMIQDPRTAGGVPDAPGVAGDLHTAAQPGKDDHRVKKPKSQPTRPPEGFGAAAGRTRGTPGYHDPGAKPGAAGDPSIAAQSQ